MQISYFDKKITLGDLRAIKYYRSYLLPVLGLGDVQNFRNSIFSTEFFQEDLWSFWFLFIVLCGSLLDIQLGNSAFF